MAGIRPGLSNETTVIADGLKSGCAMMLLFCRCKWGTQAVIVLMIGGFPVVPSGFRYLET